MHKTPIKGWANKWLSIQERIYLPVSIYGAPYPFKNLLFRDWLSLTLKPVTSDFIVLKKLMGLVPYFRMVVIQPFNLGVAQKRGLNQVETDRAHCDMLETQPRSFTELVGSLNLTYHNNVYLDISISISGFHGRKELTLNTDSELAVLVEAGFCSS